MRGLLLIALLAVIVLMGYILMKRLDGVLEERRRPEELPCAGKPDSLRVGLLNPTAADGITELLHLYAQRYPDTVVSLHYGGEEELTDALSRDSLDVIFLPGRGGSVCDRAWESSLTLLPAVPAPGKGDCGPQRLVWKKAVKNPAVSGFLECLRTREGDR